MYYLSRCSLRSRDNTDVLMKLWEPNGACGFTVTAPETQIPGEPKRYLQTGFCINDRMRICGAGCKFEKGKYTWHGVLVVPNR